MWLVPTESEISKTIPDTKWSEVPVRTYNDNDRVDSSFRARYRLVLDSVVEHRDWASLDAQPSPVAARDTSNALKQEKHS